MKLYYADRAPNPERVRFFLQEKGEWDRIRREDLNIIRQDHKRADYQAVSPLSQLPALQLDDGLVLTESRAICTYLEGVFPEPNLMGEGARERAEIEMWDRRVEFSYFIQIGHWFRNSHPSMAELESPQSAEWAEISSGRAKRMAAFFDERLASSPYVAGERFTIADITLHVSMGFGRIVRWRPWELHPNLAKWRERMLERPGLAS